MEISVAGHPLLRAAAFTSHFTAPLSELATSPAVLSLLRPDSAGATADDDVQPPVERDEALRQAVRDMLRAGGYKPTGRGKPASEYLVRAVEEGALDSINLAVDACNAVSFRSGFPISVVDLDLLAVPLRIAVAAAGDSYVFNRAGHEIDLAGLVCLFDATGPCANAVKDAQRTKTRPETTGTLSVIWGVAGHEDRLAGTRVWYMRLLADAGAETSAVSMVTGG
jgi:DNA/RNA-binding domain of Phe-tRNA-synthetase-like protein